MPLILGSFVIWMCCSHPSRTIAGNPAAGAGWGFTPSEHLQLTARRQSTVLTKNLKMYVIKIRNIQYVQKLNTYKFNMHARVHIWIHVCQEMCLVCGIQIMKPFWIVFLTFAMWIQGVTVLSWSPFTPAGSLHFVNVNIYSLRAWGSLCFFFASAESSRIYSLYDYFPIAMLICILYCIHSVLKH